MPVCLAPEDQTFLFPYGLIAGAGGIGNGAPVSPVQYAVHRHGKSASIRLHAPFAVLAGCPRV